MTFVSYAQNCEDVILRRIFKHKAVGFYIDVGACWPDVASVTKAFYDNDWRGINIEPHPRVFSVLQEQRPEDINLQIAVSSKAGTAMLYEGQSEGESTILNGVGGRRFDVDLWTLRQVCEKYVTGTIDFLKIDVEGAEVEVLQGADFVNFRPRVIVCEITKPWSNVRSVQADEIDILLSAQGYRHVHFDGLNSYYATEDDSGLLRGPWFQPNVVDRYVTAGEARLNTQLTALQAEAHRLGAEHAALQAQTHRLGVEHAAREAQLNTRLTANLNELARLHRVINEQNTWGQASMRHVHLLSSEIAALRNSSSWRITRPFRGVRFAIKRCRTILLRAPRATVRRLAGLVRRRAPRLYSKLSMTRAVRIVRKTFAGSAGAVSSPAPTIDSLPPGTQADLLVAMTRWLTGKRVDA